jgi:hypothetical protein
MNSKKIFTTALAVTALGLVATGVHAQTPAPASPAPAPTELVYLPQLPSVASLVDAAKAQGITVLKVSQTSGEVTVSYAYPNGTASTVSYQVLPSGESAAAGPAPAYGAPTAPPAPAGTAVVYAAPAPYYYDPYYYPAYYPWGWYAPVGLRIGIGGGWGGRGWGGRGWHR